VAPRAPHPADKEIGLLERALLVALGGAIGSALRYVVSLAAAHWLGAEFPYGTLIVNAAGSFAIGVIQQLGSEALLLSDNTRIFLTTGIMGGLTTYSTFSYETVRLMETEAWHQAWINVAVTTALALGLCFAGMAVGRALLHLRA
jgi:CrcB protein